MTLDEWKAELESARVADAAEKNQREADLVEDLKLQATEKLIMEEKKNKREKEKQEIQAERDARYKEEESKAGEEGKEEKGVPKGMRTVDEEEEDARADKKANTLVSALGTRPLRWPPGRRDSNTIPVWSE